MTNDEKIRELLENFVLGLVQLQVQPAKVTKVDLEKGTCSIKFLDDDLADRNNVHLNAGIGIKTGLLLEPEVGSVVYVAIVNNNPQWTFVVLYTQLKSVWIRGDQYGGLIKIEELTTQLAKNTARIDFILETLKTTITSVTLHPNPSWGGIITPLIETLQKEDYSNIENTEVKHG
ncbi:MAG: hypothetical protein QM503_04510 [Bacteroidota bacterium]